jgi:hypothetical protein
MRAADLALASELRAVHKAIEERPAISLTVPLTVDTTGLPRGSQERFIQETADQLGRMLLFPTGRLYQKMVGLIKAYGRRP